MDITAGGQETHTRSQISGRAAAGGGFTRTLRSKLRQRVGIFSSMWSVSALAVNRNKAAPG